MNDRLQKAFDAATNVTQQLITLAIAVIGGFIAFAMSSAEKTADTTGASTTGAGTTTTGAAAAAGAVKNLDFVSWGFGITFAMLCLALSVIFGLITLMRLTGELGNSAITTPSTYRGFIRFCAGAQAILFAAGAFAFAMFVPIWDWSPFS